MFPHCIAKQRPEPEGLSMEAENNPGFFVTLVIIFINSAGNQFSEQSDFTSRSCWISVGVIVHMYFEVTHTRPFAVPKEKISVSQSSFCHREAHVFYKRNSFQVNVSALSLSKAL